MRLPWAKEPEIRQPVEVEETELDREIRAAEAADFRRFTPFNAEWSFICPICAAVTSSFRSHLEWHQQNDLSALADAIHYTS